MKAHQHSNTTLSDHISDFSNIYVKSVYIHIPFCFHKCHYCDFYSLAGMEHRRDDFSKRLTEEIQHAGQYLKQSIDTIFIGGGTPTLLTVEQWRPILNAINQFWTLSADYEWTVEANPETVTAELIKTLVSEGVNRISMGAQSFNPEHLKTLERWHEPSNVDRAVSITRDSGIQKLNLDLIYAIPGQTLYDSMRDLDTAIKLNPDHISSYALTYEPNTAMTKKLELGRITAMDDETEIEMFYQTIHTLKLAGYEHYEISNFAKPGQQCKHNLAYWYNHNWFALGPSAGGHLNGTRWKNIPRLTEYFHTQAWAPVQDVETLSACDRFGEAIMMRLRLIDGIALGWLFKHPQMNQQRHAVIDREISRGHLIKTASHLKLTNKGLIQTDRIASELL